MGLLTAVVLCLGGCPKDVALPSFGVAPGSRDAGTTGLATTGSTGATGATGATGTTGNGDAGLDGGPSLDGGTGTPDGGGVFGTPADPACDLNGTWLVRQTVLSNALNGDQVATTWYLQTLRQSGESLQVVEHTDCGIYVRSASNVIGGVEVTVARDTLATMTTKNSQVGRAGTVARSTDGSRCEIQFDRFFTLYGVPRTPYLPQGPHDARDLSALMAEAPLPTDQNPAGAEDWNGTAQQGQGVAWVVGGAASGVRWSVQRSWSEWGSNASHTVMPSADLGRFVIGARYSNEENVLSTSAGILGGLLASVATPIPDDPRAQTEFLRLSPPGGPTHALFSIGDAAERCLEAQALLPHMEP